MSGLHIEATVILVCLVVVTSGKPIGPTCPMQGYQIVVRWTLRTVKHHFFLVDQHSAIEAPKCLNRRGTWSNVMTGMLYVNITPPSALDNSSAPSLNQRIAPSCSTCSNIIKFIEDQHTSRKQSLYFFFGPRHRNTSVHHVEDRAKGLPQYVVLSRSLQKAPPSGDKASRRRRSSLAPSSRAIGRLSQ